MSIDILILQWNFIFLFRAHPVWEMASPPSALVGLTTNRRHNTAVNERTLEANDTSHWLVFTDETPAAPLPTSAQPSFDKIRMKNL